MKVGNDELASAANITTFTASRIMSEWQREGLLTKNAGRYWYLSRSGSCYATYEVFRISPVAYVDCVRAI